MIKRRITWGRTFSLCAVIFIFLFDSGCVGGVLGVEKVPVGQTWLVPSPGAGVLDWQNAEFALPIDQYAMSQHDIQLVNAANIVLLIRCVNGAHPLDVVQVGNIKQWLSAVNLSQHWMFGNWDAPYVAQHGGVMGPHPTPISIEDLSLDMGQVTYCVNDDPSVLNMTPRSPMFGYVSPGPDALSALLTYWGDGVNLAESDPRYLALSEQRNKCTQAHGYSISFTKADGTGSLSYDDNWTLEQRIAAEATEAQCSDDMGFTQQVIDMIATYQLRTIADHEAELVAMKQILDQRVVDATKILTDVGLL